MNRGKHRTLHAGGQVPYGLWNSPVTPRSLSEGICLSDVQWDTHGDMLVWLEQRAGRGVLVCASVEQADAPRDLTDELSVRATVGYGGGDFTVANGVVYFIARREGGSMLYRQSLLGGVATPISPLFGHFAAPAISPDHRWMLVVHHIDQVDTLAILDTEGRQWPQQLVQNHDFFMHPRWHPGGKLIAYIAWDHPNMPWDGTVLYLATLTSGSPSPSPHIPPTLPVVQTIQPIAGGREISIFQPEFSPDGRWLSYVSDEQGWSQIYLYNLEKGTHRKLTTSYAQHGVPAWVQGLRRYGWSSDSEHIFFIRDEGGFSTLCRQHIHSPVAEPVRGMEAYTWLEQPAISPIDHTIALIASSSVIPHRLIVREDAFSPHEEAWVIRRSTTENIPPEMLSPAQPVSWDAADGETVHGLLYLPRYPGGDTHAHSRSGPLSTPSEQPGGPCPSDATPSELPPAIIKIHGGPTSQAVASYQGDIQFFTSRGYVVLSVNYRGSTGYGREYMEKLRGNWGVYDVEDAVSSTQFLVTRGIADRNRMVLLGGSAGGYTVLETLCRAPGVFKAGICLYGIANLFTLASETHKFEAHYLDRLLGPLPEASEVYRERSPLFHTHLITDPVAIFQGTDDSVVPRSQSDMLVESLRKRSVPHEYHVYEGEEHGWRKPETIERFYRAVEAFLKQYVLFS